MLRGSSRHDGIPNKQSAKDRDRDRQREQQRKERAQMLPDEKEIHASAQDLFHAPVKVKPSVEDTTAVQIRNTLGSFDTVRHLMVDGTNRKLANLVGVDQGLGTPVAHRLPSHGVEPPPYRPPSSGGSNSSSVTSEQNNTKSHYQRNLFPVNHHTTGIINNSSQGTTTITSNPGNSLFANSFRTSSTTPNPPNLVQKVPHSHNQLPPHNTNLYSVNSNSSAPIPPNAGSVLNTRSPNRSNTNNQVRSKSNLNYGHSNVNSGSVVDVSVDGVSGSSTSEKNNSVFKDEPNHNNCASAPNDKGSKTSSTQKKPAIERADSQLELESILKEMMEVTPPLTAILTPIKETTNTTTKKLTQRRSSKSEEKIVQSIIDSGMAKVPSPIKRMDTSAESSSSCETDETSDSESEDSSSGSQPGGDKSEITVPPLSVVPSTSSPTPRWDLASFITKNEISTKTANDFIGKSSNAKSPKDGKSRDSLDFETSPGELIPNAEPNVTSTSVFNKSQSASPLENLSASNLNLANHTKVLSRSRTKTDTRTESHIPPRKVPPSIPSKGQSTSKNKISSLTASSSDEEIEVDSPKKVVVPKPTVLDEKKTSTGGAVARKRSRQSSTTAGRHPPKSDGDSSPETSKSKKGVQDRNKSDTIRKLFRPARPSNWNKDKKVESPSAVESDTSKANNGTTNITPGGGKQSAATSNRISAKDSGRKSNSSSVVHNGDLDSSANYIGASDIGSKKKDGTKDKESSHPHGKKHPKQAHAANSHAKSTLPSPGNGTTTVPSASLARVKDETSLKSSSAPSSLIIRIPLDKLRRKPPVVGASTSVSTISPSAPKIDKEPEKVGKSSVVGASTTSNTDSYRLKVPHHSSRVGSSSDPSIQPFAPHDTCIPRDRDDPMCSDSERLSSKNHSSKKRPRKKSRSSPKKSKLKREPDSRTKAEEDLACGEISSNLLGYAPCDSVSVTTTRTPPIESDVVQAPDSSLNPPHLPSPVIPPQVVYYSYFEKFDHKDDIFSRDQDSYLQEAKKLKHSADGERTSTAQASMYLEAGLYFILTGILMERDNNIGSLSQSNAPYTMYKDTLNLIQYIGSRWRSRLENHNSLEAKIIVLSMRCQALLSLKLFKMKMKETKEMVQYMQDYFLRAPPRDPAPSTISSSPQLSTPSPRSPTSSPAGSSGISVLQHTPSPHHPHQNHHVTSIPRTLYSQIHKHCSNTYNVITAHETWEQADSIVAKHRVEDFFIGIDRQFGPLTLHSSLVDLVRYVKQGIQLINAS